MLQRSKVLKLFMVLFFIARIFDRFSTIRRCEIETLGFSLGNKFRIEFSYSQTTKSFFCLRLGKKSLVWFCLLRVFKTRLTRFRYNFYHTCPTHRNCVHSMVNMDRIIILLNKSYSIKQDSASRHVVCFIYHFLSNSVNQNP